MAKTRIKGGKKLDAFLKKAKGAKGVKEVEVGFYDTARYPPMRTGKNGGQRQEPHPVTLVAFWNEFGTKTIPERPFFRNAIQSMQHPILELLKSEVDSRTMIVDRRIADRVGLIGQSEVRQSITKLRTPPNAEWTKRRKGSSNPLIDTGFLRASATYTIVP